MSITFNSAPDTRFIHDELENPQSKPGNDKNLKSLHEFQWSTGM